MTEKSSTSCQRIVSMNRPKLGVTGLPNMKCGAPLDLAYCPFDETGCPQKLPQKSDGSEL